MKTPIVLLAATLAFGCAGYTTGIRPKDRVDPTSSYLYGRFLISTDPRHLGFDDHQSMGFVLHCDDKATYRIRFSNRTPVQVIKIDPSRCEVGEIIYTDADGAMLGWRHAPPGMLRNGVFLAGRAYYLGDFYAKAETSKGKFKVFHVEYRLTWKIEDFLDAYIDTTMEMKRKFPNLESLTTEDRMLNFELSSAR